MCPDKISFTPTPTQVSREDIVSEARMWVGTPWKHQGRTSYGIDCAGLPIMVGKALGLTTFDITSYPARPDGSFLGPFYDNLIHKPRADLLNQGDVVVFSESGHICHCGIITRKHGVLAVVHAHAKRRKVIEETLDSAESVIGKPIHAFEYPMSMKD